MTLPYPHGIETGKLGNIEPRTPDPLDIEQRIRRLIVPGRSCVDIAGRQLRVAQGTSVESETGRVRGLVARRLLERRPNATEATWRKLDVVLRAALSSHQELDEGAIEQMLQLVDGL